MVHWAIFCSSSCYLHCNFRYYIQVQTWYLVWCSLCFKITFNCYGGLIVLFSVGFFIIIILLVLKYIGACDSETTMVDTASREISWRTETDPILPEKSVRLTYGTTAEEDDDAETGSSSSSSEDLYDAKLCVICYDDQRNCFFVPCGHRATCCDCAQRYKVEKKSVLSAT